MKNERVNDKIIFSFSIALYAGLFIYLCIAYSGNTNRLHMKTVNKLFMQTVFPENWSYFTKSPNEPMVKLYQLKGDRFVYTDLRPFSPAYAFGMNRNNRVIGFEIRNIMDELPRDTTLRYYSCKVITPFDINQILHADTLKFNEIKTANAHLIKGKAVIAIEDFPLWADRKSQFIKPHTVKLIPVNVIPAQ